MNNLDVNARFALPTLVETLRSLGKKQPDEVLRSRFETLAVLLAHIENGKMWDAICPYPGEVGT